MSGDPEQEYFADRVVEDIITALSRVKSFFVIARNSNFVQALQSLGPNLHAFKLETPVRMPPGRLRFGRIPSLTGSPPISKTTRIVTVVDLAASAVGAPPGATITAT